MEDVINIKKEDGSQRVIKIKRLKEGQRLEYMRYSSKIEGDNTTPESVLEFMEFRNKLLLELSDLTREELLDLEVDQKEIVMAHVEDQVMIFGGKKSFLQGASKQEASSQSSVETQADSSSSR